MPAHVDPTASGPGVNGLSSETVKAPKHPKWYPPSGSHKTGLKVMNSLTETLEEFIPLNGRTIKWYTCGPTVYDMSHMGHARAYLTFDILRRVLEDYFNYQVKYQMNITDIDDKIIKRARVNKLLDDYKKEVTGKFDTFVAFVKEALAFADAGFAKKQAEFAQPLPEGTSSRVRDEREEKIKELELKMGQLEETKKFINEQVEKKAFDGLFKVASGVVGELLDSQRGATVDDHSIFDNHAKHFERAFFEDCERLGIRQPDVITRVSECVPSVVTYVEKIIANGFAYVGKSSVFFDTQAFIAAGHDYPKLKPTSDAQREDATAAEMAEGEGALTNTEEGEKKSPNDFALWKFSKPGEPRWPSPWGDGRPGWHIECSVMASDILGENMDIHAGGWDLKFPHHDNECAQAEAFWGNKQWVNYFFHCGHLHIKGLKMSKSLKNFITIRQALDDDLQGVSPRQMRLLFLFNDWGRAMNFSDQSLGAAKETERVLRAFFGSVDIVLRNDYLKQSQSYNEKDTALEAFWTATESKVHEALCNNIDTVTAMEALMELVTSTNAYLLGNERPSATLVRKVGRYITKILQVFGVVDGTDSIGFSAAQSSDSRLQPTCDALVQFRDDVRRAAREKAPPSTFLEFCDTVRDELLPPAGIRLEDKPDGPTQWKTDDPEVLMREVADRKAQLVADKKKKLVNQLETKKKLYGKWAQYEEDPVKYFSGNAERAKKYAAYNEAGVPTKTAEGEDIDEKKQGKLKKDQDKYASNHKDLQSKGGADFLKSTKAEIEAMEAQIAAL